MIIRVVHQSHYTQVRNETVRDSRLSFKATGLLVYLLSLPDDTQISRKQLTGVKRDGEEAIRTALQELTRAGYLKRRVVRQPNGTTITETTLSELSTSATTARKTNTGKSRPGKSHTSLNEQGGGPARKKRATPPEYLCAACGVVATRMAADATWWCEEHRAEYVRRSQIVPPAQEA